MFEYFFMNTFLHNISVPIGSIIFYQLLVYELIRVLILINIIYVRRIYFEALFVDLIKMFTR